MKTKLYNSNGKIILGQQLADQYDGTFIIRNPVIVFSLFGRVYFRSYSLYSTLTVDKCKSENVSAELHNVYSRFILLEYMLNDLPRKEFICLMKWSYCSRILLPFLALANLMSGKVLKDVKLEIKGFRSI